MTAFNVVRFRVKPGNEQSFIDAHRRTRAGFKGFRRGSLIRTGAQTFCMIGEWNNLKSMHAANVEMIAMLDTFRHMLEDLGNGLGVTDPISGDAVVAMNPPKPAAKKTKKKAKKKSRAKKRRR